MAIFVTAAPAQQVKSLYRAEVSAVSQQPDARAEGLREALGQVLVKVSGREDILSHPTIAERLKTPETLVNEFGYVTSSASSDDHKLTLWVSFDRKGVNSLLAEAGVPVWGVERPLILPWLVNGLPGEGAPHILTAEQDGALVEAFRKAAGQYAVPVVFPLMDLGEMTRIGPPAIEGGEWSLLMSAAKRYGSGAILAGEIQPAGTGLRLSATLRLQEGEHWEWELTEKDANALFAALAGKVAAVLSAQYATEAADTAVADIHLRVEGIGRAEDMTALTKYLQHFASVASVDILEVAGSSVVLDLHLRGGVEAFTREISVGQRLVPVDGASLKYQWKG